MCMRKVYHRVSICVALLLMLLSMTATGAAQGPPPGEENSSPDSPGPVVAYDSAPPPQPMEDNCINDSSACHGQPIQQSGHVDRPDLAWAQDDAILLGTEEMLPPILTGGADGACPLESDFNDSAPGWVAHSGTWYYNSEHLYTYGLEETWSSASYVADFTNFDYEVRMWRSGSDTSANSIVFRGTPEPLTPANNWYHEYKLQYSRDGYYSVWKRVAGGSAVPLVGWTFSPAINQGDAWNTLRVVANGTSLTFYINGTLLWSGNDTSLSSGRAGVGMYRSSGSTGDELRVDWARLCLVAEGHTICLPLVSRP